MKQQQDLEAAKRFELIQELEISIEIEEKVIKGTSLSIQQMKKLLQLMNKIKATSDHKQQT